MPEPLEEELVEIREPRHSTFHRARKKMRESEVLQAVIRYGVIAILGAGSAVATHRVEDSGQSATVQDNRSEILAIREDIKGVREGFAQRSTIEERERDAAVRKLEHRLTRIETLLEIKMGVAPMPEAAAAPTGNGR